MQPHQQRVVDEHNELRAKASKLDTFLDTPMFQELDPAERAMLSLQLPIMEAYLGVLELRIANFK